MAVLAIVSLSCVVSLMILFVGGGQPGNDTQQLLLFQALTTPVALAISVWGILRFTRPGGLKIGLQAMWSATPQWLVFIFLLLNSLVLLGEIAYVVVMRATNQNVGWYEHIPLISMFLSTTAYMVLHALINSGPDNPPAMSGRWG